MPGDDSAAEAQAVLAGLRAEAERLRAELDAVRASFSWRLTRPVRATGRILRWCRRVVRPGTAPAPFPAGTVDAVAVPPPGPPDPNAAYLFRPGAFVDGGEGVVTVEELHHLSRGLEPR